MKFTKNQLIPLLTFILLLIVLILKFNDVSLRNFIVLLVLIDQTFITKDWLHLSEKAVMCNTCFIICVGAIVMLIF